MDFSSDSFMIENPYTVRFRSPDSAGGFGKQLLPSRFNNRKAVRSVALLVNAPFLTGESLLIRAPGHE